MSSDDATNPADDRPFEDTDPAAEWNEGGWRAAVWVPGAARVEVVTGSALTAAADERLPMTRDAHDWWRMDGRLPHGRDYAFAVDGGEPRPDPRSAWQPDGVHGPSRVFDPARHEWTSTDWTGRDARGAVTMEVHVGTFTPEGTLDAAIGRLDHLVDLGVDMVELMPLAAFSGDHGWGYDGVALYAVHTPYGGPAALQRFVDAAHARGLAVCLDVVYNHLGPSGNYLAGFGPYFTDRHHTPWGQAINLDDTGSAEVRQWIVDNACRWLREFRIDALRLDAVHALVDDSETHLLAELADRVDWLAAEVDRPLSLIAESDLNDPIMIEPTGQGGMGMTMQWADDVHHAINANVTGETHGYYVDFGGREALEKVLTRAFFHDGSHSTFRGRDWGKPVPPGTDGHRFVAFSSDHDQTGNRALGDRPSARTDDDGLAISAALVLTSAFTPMLFMGDEWGARTPWQFFTDHREPELAEAIRKGRASEFGGHGWTALYGGEVTVPDPQARETFEHSRLDWSELDAPRHRRLLDWHRQLIALRRAEPELADGDLDGVGVTRGDDWLVVHRGALRIVIVLGEAAAAIALDAPLDAEPLAAWNSDRLALDEDGAIIAPGRSVTVLRTREAAASS